MNTDQESLLSPDVRFSSSPNRANLGALRWRKNIFMLVVIFSIIICLSIYLYLNMQAINGGQLESAPFKPLSRRRPMLDHESIFSDSGPSMIRLSDLLAHCIVALKVAGREVVNQSLAHNNKLHHIGSKGKTKEGADDIVTGVDLNSNNIIVTTIKDTYRRLRIISEEDSTRAFENTTPEDDILPIDRSEFANLLRNNLHEVEDQNAPRLIAQDKTLVWIDPLDATKEYSENLTDYVTLMACIVYKESPIAGVIFKPFSNETYWSFLDPQTEQQHYSPDLRKAMYAATKSRPSDKLRIVVSRSHAGNVRDSLISSLGNRVEIVSAGGSGYKTIELINGRADAYIHLTHIKKWDICAPHAIVSSIKGGEFSDLGGYKINFSNPKEKVADQGLIASLQPSVYSELLSVTKSFRTPKN